MRVIHHYCQNELVGRLLSEFTVSQGPLFHYTDRAAAAGITNGEIWVTRADCFLDPKEIQHGLKTLSDAARATLSEPDQKSFFDVLEALHGRLRSCFVLSLSQDGNNEHLRNEYAGNDGVVLEFTETFPHILCGGWHAVRTSEDSCTLHHAVDIYDFFEGFVEYNDCSQKELARMACEAYRSLLVTDTHIVDAYHFVNVLLQGLVLFKSKSFVDEDEYRIALVQKPGIAVSFEEIRNRGERQIVYLKFRIPSPWAAAIQSRHL